MLTIFVTQYNIPVRVAGVGRDVGGQRAHVRADAGRARRARGVHRRAGDRGGGRGARRAGAGRAAGGAAGRARRAPRAGAPAERRPA